MNYESSLITSKKFKGMIHGWFHVFISVFDIKDDSKM